MRFSHLSRFFFLCLAFASAPGLQKAMAAADARFSLVGTGGKAFAQKLGLTYYALEGNYPSSGNVFTSVNPVNDPPAGHKLLRKVAKLNVRNDTLGQTNAQFEAALGAFANSLAAWHTAHIGPKPVFAWYAPTVAVAAAESAQIVTTIRREKTLVPAVTGTVWEIGNEPNLFPAVLPATYAAIFARYYKIIKTEDPAAKVAMGPVFVRETSMDLLPRMREVQTQKLIEQGLGQPGQPVFDSVNNDLWLAYSARTLNLGTVDYFAQALAALDNEVKPDVISLHVYPFEDRLPFLGDEQIKRVLDSLADSLASRFQKRGANPALWVTEFGNINPGYSAEQAAEKAGALIDIFKANARFQNWFYYKGTGVDEQLSGLSSLPPPLTRLAIDGSFDPANGNFPCARLNAIGLMYYQRARGVECVDASVGFATATSAGAYQNVVNGQTSSIRVRLTRAVGDTVRVNVARSGGALVVNSHYSFAPGTLTFPPGDTSQTLVVTWHMLPTTPSTAILSLRNPVNVSLLADSSHRITAGGPEVLASFATASSTTGFAGDVIYPPVSIQARLSKTGLDTVRLTVAPAGGTLQEGTHYTLTTPTLTFLAGDTSKSVGITWKTTNVPGSVILRLRNPFNAKLSGDTTHTIQYMYSPPPAVLPGLPGASLSLDPARAALVFTAPRGIDLSVRLLDAAGRTHVTFRRRTEAGRNTISLTEGSRNGILPAGLYRVEVSGPGFRQVFSLPWLNL